MKHISVDQSSCFGCRICEIICSFTKEKEINPAKARIKVEPKMGKKAVVHVCHKCETPVCESSCPIHAIKMENGILTLLKPCIESCTLCADACPHQGIVLLPEHTVAVCDVCGECITFCPVDAIHIVGGDSHA